MFSCFPVSQAHALIQRLYYTMTTQYRFDLVSFQDILSIWKEYTEPCTQREREKEGKDKTGIPIDRLYTLLSPTQRREPVDSKVRQSTEPAVLQLPPFTAFPVDTLNTFTWALLFPIWWEAGSQGNPQHSYTHHKMRLYFCSVITFNNNMHAPVVDCKSLVQFESASPASI